MRNTKRKLLLSVIGNFISLLVVTVCVIVTEAHGSYWRYGPSDDLIIINIKIDDQTKYLSFLGLLAFINVMKIISEEVGMPILHFNVYNPDKLHITEFGKLELQVMANSMFMITSTRSMLMILVNISQIDIALWNVFVQELTTVIAIRMILNEKTFDEPGYTPIPERPDDTIASNV